MKQKLTITVDAELLPLAKRYARSRGVSLSSLIEQSLREVAAARACGARFIVTRNVQDYARSPMLSNTFTPSVWRNATKSLGSTPPSASTA